MLYPYPYCKSVVICGDIHGDFSTLEKKIVDLDLHDTLLIVAGDCGLGFRDFNQHMLEFLHMQRYVKPRNCHIAMMRGNHDDPSYFDEQKINHPHFRTIADGSIIQCANHTIYLIGGAISVDRSDRIKAMKNHTGMICYWADEQVRYGDFERAEIGAMTQAGIKIDTVISHSAPSFCPPKWKDGLKSWAVRDPWLIHDCEEERQLLDLLHDDLLRQGHPISHWFYGHFHQSSALQEGEIQFVQLNEMEFASLA